MLIGALLEHYDSLVGRLQRRFGDREAAQDVVHDVCVRLLSAPPDQRVHSPRAFLYRVSVDLAIDRHRAVRGRDRLHDAASGTGIDEVAGGLDPERTACSGQMLEAMFAVIDRLPARCRDVFILHKLHEIPQEEIASRLGISRNMVARHVMRAMQDLRLLLEGEEQGP